MGSDPAVGDAVRRLTARQREILRELLNGKTNEEIAERLFITLETVKSHVSEIYQRVGVGSRIDLWRAVVLEMEESLKTTLIYLPAPVFIVTDQALIWMNPAAEEVTGTSIVTLRQQDRSAIVHIAASGARRKRDAANFILRRAGCVCTEYDTVVFQMECLRQTTTAVLLLPKVSLSPARGRLRSVAQTDTGK